MGKVIVAVLIVAGLAVGGYFLFVADTGASAAAGLAEKKFFEVSRGNLLVPISETGILKAEKSTSIRSGVNRELKITFLAEEGARVKKGDVLVRFETTDLDREIDAEKQAIQAAETQYEAARVDLEIQKTDWANEVDKAALTLDEAKKNEKKYKEGELPLKERENRVRLEEAKTNLERARDKLAQMPALLKEGFVTPEAVEQKTIEVKKAEVTYESAKSELALFEKYTKPLELEKKKAAIEQAEAALEAVQKRIAVKSKQKAAELKSMALSLEDRRARLKNYLDDRAKMEIKAPTDGLVIYGEPEDEWRGREELKVGSAVYRHVTIITLPDLSRMQATLRIHEMDIERIRLGMAAAVTVEAAGSKVFPATITRIAELATAGGWRSDPEVKQFDVEVTLTDENPGLKPGTTAKVEIVMAELRDVVYVPVPAVRGVKNKRFCYVQGAEALGRRDVVLGLANDKFVEIKEGLQPGEQVLVSPPPAALLAEEDALRRQLTRGRGEAASKGDAP